MAEGVTTGAVVENVLKGLAAGLGYDDLADAITRDRPAGAGEALMELAADAFEGIGATRDAPVEWDGLRERYLPEWRFGGNVQHQKSRYALWGAALTSAGLRPEDAGWWRSDDLWQFALAAVVIYVRVAADRRGLAIDAVALNSLGSAAPEELGVGTWPTPERAICLHA